MIGIFLKKLRETFFSIIPMIVVITVLFLLSFSMPSNFGGIVNDNPVSFISLSSYLIFLVCSVFLILGSTLFQLGADNALSKVGSEIGSHIVKSKSFILLALITVALGVLISIAEPDLSVLGSVIGNQIDENVGTWVVKICAGIGVGLFLTLGLFRILYQRSIKYVFAFGYFLIFAIAALFGPDKQAFLSISFDTSGVTTGPATVPFVIAFGAAIASARGGKDVSGDSFGLSGIMSMGPIITMLLLTLIKRPDIRIDSLVIEDSLIVLKDGSIFYEMILDVLLGVGPLFLFFLFYNFVFLKLSKNKFIHILIGFALTFVGLYLFLLAATLGFKGLAFELGKNIASNEKFKFLFIIIGILTGLIIVLGEPSIQILTSQVEEISGGEVKKRTMTIALAIGIGAALSLEFARNIFWNGFSSFYFFIPIFIVALSLLPFVNDIYAAIAFDSGGIASGTISVCFVLPLVIGMSKSINADINAFGIIGMVSTVPIICVEFVGVASKIKSMYMLKKARESIITADDIQIIHFKELEDEKA